MDAIPQHPAKAVHSWSLFRTMGRFVGAGSMPSGDLPEGGGGGLALLDLPAALAQHAYRSVQLCHFYLPSRDRGYLAEVRGAFADAAVEVESFLIDDGDLTHPLEGEAQLEWVSRWITVGEELGAQRVRVVAGKQPPTPQTLATSARRLVHLATRHPGIRLVTENWHALLPHAAAVNELLDQLDGQVGFLVDLANWTGDTKYSELAAVAPRAETCQAKVRAHDDGTLDLEDYRRSLAVLRDVHYAGPLALVHDGPDPDEWARLDEAYALVSDVFAPDGRP